jgi:hypothetical protein
MTLANMRAQGMRSLSVTCWLCHHGAVLDGSHLVDRAAIGRACDRAACAYYDSA